MGCMWMRTLLCRVVVRRRADGPYAGFRCVRVHLYVGFFSKVSEAEYSAMLVDGLKELVFLRYCPEFYSSSGQGHGAGFLTKPLYQGSAVLFLCYNMLE